MEITVKDPYGTALPLITYTMFSKHLAFILPATLVAFSKAETVQLSLAITPPSSASDFIPNNFQSFSIELAFWADYAGWNTPKYLVTGIGIDDCGI
jgi:hypothetical protein